MVQVLLRSRQLLAEVLLVLREEFVRGRLLLGLGLAQDVSLRFLVLLGEIRDVGQQSILVLAIAIAQITHFAIIKSIIDMQMKLLHYDDWKMSESLKDGISPKDEIKIHYEMYNFAREMEKFLNNKDQPNFN